MEEEQEEASECCEDNYVCKSSKLAICTMLCPVVATAMVTAKADEIYDNGPGLEDLIAPIVVGFCQIFCCHVGGIVGACVIINKGWCYTNSEEMRCFP